jgi:hypothetical protein
VRDGDSTEGFWPKRPKNIALLLRGKLQSLVSAFCLFAQPPLNHGGEQKITTTIHAQRQSRLLREIACPEPFAEACNELSLM